LIGAGVYLYRNQQRGEEARIAKTKRELRSEPGGLDLENAAEPVEAASDRLEVMRVYRRPIDGSLSLQVMGRTADQVEEMTPGQVEQLKRVVREIAIWVEGRSGAISTGGRPDLTGGMAAPAAAETGAQEDPGQVAPGAYFADTLPPMPPTRDLLLGWKKKPDKPEKALEPPKSIAAQIDEILQDLLAPSPLNNQGIRLSEVPGGGLLILHGARSYQAIDEVEDESVRALIKQAVQAWNERNNLKN
jgi:hypothetical protein